MRRSPDPRRAHEVRRRRRGLAGSALVATSCLAAALLPVRAAPAGAISSGYNVRVVVRAQGEGGAPIAGGVAATKLSADGRWLAYERVDGGGVFVMDLLSDHVERVSSSDSGVPANAPAHLVGISANGSHVAFSTGATNMGVTGGTASDLYLRDRVYRYTLRANLLPNDAPIAVQPANGWSLSDDGWTVVFTTYSGHVYARHLFDGATEQVDLSSSSISGNGQSVQPAVAAQGRYVVFASVANNLVAGDTNASTDVFRRDMNTGTTIRVSLGDNGQTTQPSFSPSVTPDGRYVAFASIDAKLVDGDTNGQVDVFRRDVSLLTTVRVSVADNGSQTAVGSVSQHPDITDDGRYVVFESNAENLDRVTPNGTMDVFRRDVEEGFTDQVDLNQAGQAPNGASSYPSIAAPQTGVAFLSAATNVVAGDSNGATDAFVVRTEKLGPHPTMAALAKRQVQAFDAPSATVNPRTTDLVNGRTSPPHLISLLAHAPVWASNRAPVSRLYEAFFHRRPDLGGLDYWVKRYGSGTRLYAIAASFAQSAEFKATYGNVASGAFVSLVYGNVLQRQPDASGLAYWTKKLDGGMSRGALMVQFSESSEGKDTLSPAVDATLIGVGMFGAMPPTALYLAAAKAARETDVPEGAALVYLISPEYASAVDGL